MNLFRSIRRNIRGHSRRHNHQERRTQPTRELTKEEKMDRQRQARNLWYAYYLQPHVTVLKSSHFLPEAAAAAAAASFNDLVCQPVGTDTPKVLKLWNSRDGAYHTTDAECAICLGEYERGDEIVQSSAHHGENVCPHVFHKECMMQWLERGHKRCPFCRNWFVCPEPLKQQMREAHVVTTQSLCHLYDAKTMKDLVSLVEDTGKDKGIRNEVDV